MSDFLFLKPWKAENIPPIKCNWLKNVWDIQRKIYNMTLSRNDHSICKYIVRHYTGSSGVFCCCHSIFHCPEGCSSQSRAFISAPISSSVSATQRSGYKKTMRGSSSHSLLQSDSNKSTFGESSKTNVGLDEQERQSFPIRAFIEAPSHSKTKSKSTNNRTTSISSINRRFSSLQENAKNNNLNNSTAGSVSVTESDTEVNDKTNKTYVERPEVFQQSGAPSKKFSTNSKVFNTENFLSRFNNWIELVKTILKNQEKDSSIPNEITCEHCGKHCTTASNSKKVKEVPNNYVAHINSPQNGTSNEKILESFNTQSKKKNPIFEAYGSDTDKNRDENCSDTSDSSTFRSNTETFSKSYPNFGHSMLQMPNDLIKNLANISAGVVNISNCTINFNNNVSYPSRNSSKHKIVKNRDNFSSTQEESNTPSNYNTRNQTLDTCNTSPSSEDASNTTPKNDHNETRVDNIGISKSSINQVSYSSKVNLNNRKVQKISGENHTDFGSTGGDVQCQLDFQNSTPSSILSQKKDFENSTASISTHDVLKTFTNDMEDEIVLQSTARTDDSKKSKTLPRNKKKTEQLKHQRQQSLPRTNLQVLFTMTGKKMIWKNTVDLKSLSDVWQTHVRIWKKRPEKFQIHQAVPIVILNILRKIILETSVEKHQTFRVTQEVLKKQFLMRNQK